MPEDRFRNEAAALASLAGISVPDGRLAALQLGLSANQAAARPVLERDYGETEPAYRFRAPGPR